MFGGVDRSGMNGSGLSCHERRELEKRIHASIRSITYSSGSAAKIAGGTHGNEDFRVLQAEYAAERTRLETLLECLALHQRLHGCDKELTTHHLPLASIAYHAQYRRTEEGHGSRAFREHPDGSSNGHHSRSESCACENEEARGAIEAENSGD